MYREGPRLLAAVRGHHATTAASRVWPSTAPVTAGLDARYGLAASHPRQRRYQPACPPRHVRTAHGIPLAARTNAVPGRWTLPAGTWVPVGCPARLLNSAHVYAR